MPSIAGANELRPGAAWHVTDVYGDSWHLLLTSADAREASEDAGARAQLEQLVFDGFTHSGAVDDAIAGPLLEVYDALTNARLSERLERPTLDPDGLLRGMEHDIRHTLLHALGAGELRVERAERPRWPFVETDDAGAKDADAPVSEVSTWIGLCLVDQTGKPVRNRPYRLTLPDGTVQEGRLGSDGTARVEGIASPGTCKIDFLDFDKVDWGPQTLQPGGTIPGMTGPVVPLADEQIQISLVDDEGNPVAGANYCVTAANGQQFTGQLDANGAALVTGLPPGKCTVSFPDLDGGDFV